MSIKAVSNQGSSLPKIEAPKVKQDSSLPKIEALKVAGVIIKGQTIILPQGTSPRAIGLRLYGKKTKSEQLEGGIQEAVQQGQTVLQRKLFNNRKEYFQGPNGWRFVPMKSLLAPPLPTPESQPTSQPSSTPESQSTSQPIPTPVSQPTSQPTPVVVVNSADPSVDPKKASELGNDEKGCCLSRLFSSIWNCVAKAFKALGDFICCRSASTLVEKYDLLVEQASKRPNPQATPTAVNYTVREKLLMVE